MLTQYDPKNWYWIVAGDATKVYSSAVGDYVPIADAAYQAWLAAEGLPTRIDTADNLAEVLASASVRPANADMLDRFKGAQADKLTVADLAKVVFNLNNRIRVLEGQQVITPAQFKNTLKAML